MLASCFTKEELAFLKEQPRFMEAYKKIENTEDGCKAVTIGEQLIEETWHRKSHTDSEFTPKKL